MLRAALTLLTLVATALTASAATIATSVVLEGGLAGSGTFTSCSSTGTTTASCSTSFTSPVGGPAYGAWATGSIVADELAIHATGSLVPNGGIAGDPVGVSGAFRATITQSLNLTPDVHFASPYALVNVTGSWRPDRSTYQLWVPGAETYDRTQHPETTSVIDRAFVLPMNGSGPTDLTLEMYLAANDYDLPDDWSPGISVDLNVNISGIEFYDGNPFTSAGKAGIEAVDPVPEPTTHVLAGLGLALLLAVARMRKTS